MAEWYTLAEVRDVWADAPPEPDEGPDILADILEAARIAVLAYAPALPAPEGAAPYSGPTVSPSRGVPLYGRGTSWWASIAADVLSGLLDAPDLFNASAGGSNTPSLAYQYADHPTDKWTPGASEGIVLMDVGAGESLSEIPGREPQFRRVFESAVTTAIRWHRAASAHRGDDATITLGPGAALESIAVSGVALSPGIKLNANGEYFEITVPAGVTEIALLTAPWRQSAEAENADYLVSIDGVFVQQGTTKGMGDPRNDAEAVLITLASMRLTGLQEGEVIRVTQAGGGTLWAFGYLVMDADTVPPVILSQAFAVPDMVPGALEVYRQLVVDIAASDEWQGGVVVSDASGSITPADLDPDDKHPSLSGHIKLAGAADDVADDFGPDDPVVQIPVNYRHAQLLQTQNLWNSAYASPGGDLDNGSYGLTTFPLDWQVQQLLRPKQGKPVVA